MFELTLYPALDGDCHVLAWGDPAAPHRLLIDGGRESTWDSLKAELAELPHAQRKLELFVVSHVDADHIAGALELVNDPQCPVSFADVWFNAYHHLVTGNWETYGPAQGERLSDRLVALGWPWNARFAGKAVVARDGAAPPALALAGGLTITLLSPTPAKLALLADKWKKWLADEGLLRGRTTKPPAVRNGYEAFGSINVEALASTADTPDTAIPNGSSIAFIAEYEGKRVLLTADAHPTVIEAALAAMPGEAGRFDLVKVPHHGSADNTTQGLLRRIETSRFVFSTNGTRNHHPRPETVAKILKRQAGRRAADPGLPNTTLFFNYGHKEATLWDDAALMAKYRYACVMGAEGRLTIPI